MMYTLRLLLVGVLCSSLPAPKGGTYAGGPNISIEPCNDKELEMRIVIPQNTFKGGSVIHIQILITNKSKKTIFLPRRIGQCSSFFGSLSVQLRDAHGDLATKIGCSIDGVYDDLDLVRFLTSSETGVLLEPGEIFGKEQEYELPKQRGKYQIQAELVPISKISPVQEEELRKKDINIPRCIYYSSPATLEVK